MKEKMDELEAKKAALIALVTEAELKASIHEFPIDMIERYLSRYANIHSMEPEEQKRVVDMFVLRVTVDEDTIDVDIILWDGPPSDDDNKDNEQRKTKKRPNIMRPNREEVWDLLSIDVGIATI